MFDDWQLSAQHAEVLIKAGDISAAIRHADDAHDTHDTNWELNDDLPALEPFDPFADDPE